MLKPKEKVIIINKNQKLYEQNQKLLNEIKYLKTRTTILEKMKEIDSIAEEIKKYIYQNQNTRILIQATDIKNNIKILQKLQKDE